MKVPQHILVIRLSAMGDVAMSLPVLKAVSEKYPDLKITLLTRRFFAPVFKDLKNVTIYEADVKGRHKGIRGLKRLADELSDLGIDAVADLHNVLRSNILKMFFKLKSIPVEQLEKNREGRKALTRKNNKIFQPLRSSQHRYADVFSTLGFPVEIDKVAPLSKPELDKRTVAITGSKSTRWVGIAPFAQHASKVYPQDLMENVIQELQKDQDLKIFLFGGGPEEKRILSKWESQFTGVVNIAGKLTFQEELALISHLDVMLSMDSGNGHLAANYGVPVLTMWGLTHPYTGFRPFRQPEENAITPDLQKYPAIPTSIYGKEVPPGYEDVMRSIAPQQVVQKLKEILKK